ncbi:meiotic recombination protein SPO11-1 [Medicago truncatula]|uniref:DNA topoisomerase (ATP-hydrolyzing) n=1 Tax=Medicago truncatula TaxID=3880 RepID=G7K4J4_MEDTR|nr:meiotic recombination protein SPO11-1 [Medicago truncatula]AET00710.2 meiotic recombination SPO11-like protein [Medicago truncatula]
MEGKRMKLESQKAENAIHLLDKIKEFTRSLLINLTNGNSSIILINRFRNHCTLSDSNCFCGSDLPVGNEVLTLCKETRVHRLGHSLYLLLSSMCACSLIILLLFKLGFENKHSSKRDIYYMHPSVFLDQSVVDHAINDICVRMQCSRHNLNVVSAGNGLVMGWIRFVEGKKIFDCINSPNTAHPTPVYVEEIKDIVSMAHYILVVEKESVFRILANDHFCNANHCIVISGRGYPDIPTRRFLRLLVDNLYIPAYCLVDCDPYGFDILTTYRFGSMQMAYDTKHLRVPEIHWLGAFPSDSDRYFVPKQCLLPLTVEDKRKIKAMLLRCYLQREVPEWRLELRMMLQKGVKFEIEALSVHTLSFLTESYIPSKIHGKVKI